MTSVHDKITDRIRLARRAAITDGLIAALPTGLGLAGLLSTSLWLTLMITPAMLMLLNIRWLIPAVRALHAYDACPAAAYLIELQHALTP